jgi:hypothetical protein
MAITGQPKTIPATTYSTYWLTGLILRSQPSGRSTATAMLQPYTTGPDGKPVAVAVQPIVVSIGDLAAEAKADPEFAATIALLEAKVQALAVAKKLI